MESSAHNDHDLPRQNHLRRNARLRRARSDLPSTSVAILNTGMAAEDKSTRLKSSMTIAFIRPLGGFGARRPRTAQVRSFLHWKPQRTRKRTRRGYLHLHLRGAGIRCLLVPAQCPRTAHRERTAVLPNRNPSSLIAVALGAVFFDVGRATGIGPSATPPALLTATPPSLCSSFIVFFELFCVLADKKPTNRHPRSPDRNSPLPSPQPL